MRNWNEWTVDEVAFLIANYNKLTNAQLSACFPERTWESIYKKARKLGMVRVPEIVWANKSAAKSGAKAPNWKGGRLQNKAGYVLILDKFHHRAAKSGYVMEHIVVWENFNGRTLPDGYCIHHKNGIKNDNRPENLEALPHGEHTAITHRGLKRSAETRAKISEKRLSRC